jgi:hypothetical protein
MKSLAIVVAMCHAFSSPSHVQVSRLTASGTSCNNAHWIASRTATWLPANKYIHQLFDFSYHFTFKQVTLPGYENPVMSVTVTHDRARVAFIEQD